MGFSLERQYVIFSFVETPRKFITAKLSIRKPGSSSDIYQVERLGMVQLLLLGDLPPERHNPFNCIDPLVNGSPDETAWSFLDRVCMPMLPNDNTISVRTDPRSSYRPFGHNPKNCIAIQTKPQGKTRSPNLRSCYPTSCLSLLK